MVILNDRYESTHRLKMKADRANITANIHGYILHHSPNTFCAENTFYTKYLLKK